MGNLTWTLERKSSDDDDSLIKRAGTLSGKMLGQCDKCKLCGNTLNDSATNLSDGKLIHTIIVSISGSKAGTKECPIYTSQN